MAVFVSTRSAPAMKVIINGSNFIEEYANQWGQYALYLFSMKKLFDPLDRFFLKGTPNLQNIASTAL